MAENIAGIDPHQNNFTIGVIDPNGVEISHDSFDNTGEGYIKAIDLLSNHDVGLVGVEGSAKLGAHVSIALAAAGFDCREVPPQRSAAQRQTRRLAKTDVVDSYSTARALLAEPTLSPVQALETVDPYLAELEAVLEHRRMLVSVRIVMLTRALSSGEGRNKPMRHRLDMGGNRRVNSVIHVMSVTQVRANEKAKQYLERKTSEGKTRKEARRAHKKQLANRIIRRMWKDQKHLKQQTAA